MKSAFSDLQSAPKTWLVTGCAGFIGSNLIERLLKLRVGATCVVSKPRLCLKTLRKYAPEGRWMSESREGGLVVTRVR